MFPVTKNIRKVDVTAKQVFIIHFLQRSQVSSENGITWNNNADADLPLFSYVIKGALLTYNYSCSVLFESSVDRVIGGD